MKKLVLALAVIMASIAINASEIDLEKAQNALSATFNNFSFSAIEESPIPGFVEIHTATGIVYFNPDLQLLIFGQVFNHIGENLTEKSKQDALGSMLSTLPLENAVTLGEPGGIDIIEFTNPNCSHCIAYNNWQKEVSNAFKVKRHIFLVNSTNFPEGERKFAHILCSANKAAAHDAVYQNLDIPLTQCPDAQSKLAEHDEVVRRIGIQATPSFVINGELITGFNKRKIIESLQRSQKTTSH